MVATSVEVDDVDQRHENGTHVGGRSGGFVELLLVEELKEEKLRETVDDEREKKVEFEAGRFSGGHSRVEVDADVQHQCAYDLQGHFKPRAGCRE